MDKMQSLQAQKDDLKVRHAQEIKTINKKISAEKNRQKKANAQSRKQRNSAYSEFKAKTEEMKNKDLIKKLKKIIEDEKNENTK